VPGSWKPNSSSRGWNVYAKAFCALVLALTLAAGCASVVTVQDSRLLRARVLREEARKDLDEAIALVAQLRYDEAADKLSPLPEAFDAAGDSPSAAEAMFWLAYCHEKRGRTDRAASLYQNVIRSFPATPAARQAADRLTRLNSSTFPSQTPSPPR